MADSGDLVVPFPDEPELVERVRQGDDRTFETLVNRYADQAFALAFGAELPGSGDPRRQLYSSKRSGITKQM